MLLKELKLIRKLDHIASGGHLFKIWMKKKNIKERIYHNWWIISQEEPYNSILRNQVNLN